MLVHVSIGDVDSLIANLPKRGSGDVGEEAMAPKCRQSMHVAKLEFASLRLPVGNCACVACTREPENVRHLIVPESQVELAQAVREILLEIRRPGTRGGSGAPSGKLREFSTLDSHRRGGGGHDGLRLLSQIELQPEAIHRSAKIRTQ